MKNGFFDDENGNRSMMRLLAFIVVTTGVAIITLASVWMILFDVDLIGLIGVIIGFVTTGLGAKFLQKTTETKNI